MLLESAREITQIVKIGKETCTMFRKVDQAIFADFEFAANRLQLIAILLKAPTGSETVQRELEIQMFFL